MEHGSCRHLLESLSSYVDQELSQELCAEIERHLENCENCQVVINTLRKTIDLYHETAVDALTPEQVRQRLFMRLELEDYLKNA